LQAHIIPAAILADGVQKLPRRPPQSLHEEVSMKTWVPVSLIFATFIVLCGFSWLFMSSHNISSPQIFVVLVLTDLFVFATICTFAIILLWGIGTLHLDTAFVKWLGAATIGEIAGMVAIAIKWLFQTHTQ
jgi:hypothetical protein